jgi:hypothetical protein
MSVQGTLSSLRATLSFVRMTLPPSSPRQSSGCGGTCPWIWVRFAKTPYSRSSGL